MNDKNKCIIINVHRCGIEIEMKMPMCEIIVVATVNNDASQVT
jgi:hypothetical protein